MSQKYENVVNVIKNYIYTKKINLNLSELKISSDDIYELIITNFSHCKQDYTGQSTMSTKIFSSYNLLLYPLNGFHELYNEIKQMFYEINTYSNNGVFPDKKYYIQCWLNYYNKDDYIDWHSHWGPEFESWHGFYCLDCEESYTSYIIPGDDNNITNVSSENNLIVFSKSDGDKHKSSKWLNPDRPRITIAFDIVPKEHINHSHWLNHWIPI